MLELVVPLVHLLFLLNCCLSCRQSQFPRSTVHNFAQALFLITVHWNVSVPCLQHLQELLKIFEFDERLLQTVLSRTGSDQNHDLCTLLTVLDDHIVKVCCV